MNTRKKLLIIIISALALIAVLMAVISILSDKEKNGTEADVALPDEYFYTPDYTIDIQNDPEYLELNRIISYKNGAVTISVTPEKYSETDPVLNFISSYLQVLVCGEYEKYSEYFTEKYKQNNTLPEKFTMQRIHNISVEKISETTNDSGEVLYVYMLDYMIDKNNGTFRRDIDSSSSRPLYYVLLKSGDSFIIDEIIRINEK